MRKDLFEVIASRSKSPAFGVTFDDKAEADSYAASLEARGYQVDPYPPFQTERSAKAALRTAAAVFKDERLANP